MRTLILFILISFLGDIGKAVQIKVHGQPKKNDKKLLSEVLAEVSSESSTYKLAQQLSPPPPPVSVKSTKDYKELLGEIDAEAIMKGDTKAIVGGINQGTSLITTFLDNKQFTAGLGKLANGLKFLAFTGPVASITLDLFFGKNSDPLLDEINQKLDKLSAKLDTYHGETMQALKGLSAEICESAFSTQRSTLDTLNNFMTKFKREYSPFVLFQVCGPYLSNCFSAFTTIALNFPLCLDKIIEASEFTGEKDLRLGGNRQKVDPKINSYISLMTVSLSNFGRLMGKYYAEDVSSISPLNNRELYDLKIASEFLESRMQYMLTEIQKRLPQLTDYKVYEWPWDNILKQYSHTFMVDWDYAIMGLWRGRGEKLTDLKYALAGKGVLSHGGHAYVDRVLFRDNLMDKWAGSLSNERTSSCPANYHLRGFEIYQMDHGQWFVSDLFYGLCITSDTQFHYDGWEFWEEECYTQDGQWAKQESWLMCSKLGYYIAGLERGARTGRGLDSIFAIKCCRPKMITLGHRRE